MNLCTQINPSALTLEADSHCNNCSRIRARAAGKEVALWLENNNLIKQQNRQSGTTLLAPSLHPIFPSSSRQTIPEIIPGEATKKTANTTRKLANCC